MTTTRGTLTEEDLVERLTSRDSKVMAVLYDMYAAALYGVALRVVNSEDVAKDVLQDAFVKIWLNGKTYDSSKGRLFTWMLNICRNTAIDVARSSGHRMSADIQIAPEDVHMEGYEQNTDLIGVKEKVGNLKPELKEAIDLLYYGGYTQVEAAKELGVPLGTLKTRARIAIRELRKLMTTLIQTLWM